MRKPLVEATIRETTRKKRKCPTCISIGVYRGIDVFNSQDCPTHRYLVGLGVINEVEDCKLVGEAVSREKKIDRAILVLDNKIDTLSLKRRKLLSMKGFCMSCGEKTLLNPVLNGVCDPCEMLL